jgi:hypothetical protein
MEKTVWLARGKAAVIGDARMGGRILFDCSDWMVWTSDGMVQIID